MKIVDLCRVGIVIAVCFLLVSFGTGRTQEEIFFLGHETGVGARAMTMGGAFVGIADDYSAIYWNPAGLGQSRRMELNVGFSHNKVTDNATFLDSEFKGENSFSRLNSLGFVFPVPTFQGSLVFAVGYNRVRDYENVLEIEGFNENYAAYPDLVLPTYEGYNYTTVIDDSLKQVESLLEDGSLNHFSLSGAVEIQENFFLGLTLNFISGKNNYDMTFQEEDVLHIYDETYEDVIADLDYWTYNNTIASELRATSLKLGGLYKYGKTLRLGASIVLPTKYRIKEFWTEKFEETYEWGTEEPFTDSGDFSYEISEPYSFNFGASFKLLNVLLSSGIDIKDWSQAKFLTDTPLAGVSKSDINTYIKRELKTVTTFRLGAEVFVPLIRARVRGGYYVQPTAYRYKNHTPDKHYVTGGLGIMLGKQTLLELGLVHGMYEQETTDYLTNLPTLEEVSFDKIIGTLSMRW